MQQAKKDSYAIQHNTFKSTSREADDMFSTTTPTSTGRLLLFEEPIEAQLSPALSYDRTPPNSPWQERPSMVDYNTLEGVVVLHLQQLLQRNSRIVECSRVRTHHPRDHNIQSPYIFNLHRVACP